MSGHTPGPWIVEMGALYAYRIMAKTQRGLWKAVAQVGGFFRSDREANARLMCAAPDLLKAAKEVMDLLEKHGPSIVPHLMDTDENAGQRLRDAIAKAEGK